MKYSKDGSFLSSVVSYFSNSKLTPLIIFLSILIGFLAVLSIPREEEPQISVPMFDVFVSFPGATPEVIEKQVVNLGERKLWEIPGVEYIYSTIESHQALIIIRFKVGEDIEKSLIKLYTKVYSNLDWLPRGSMQPLIKVRSIDDVPVMALSFYSAKKSGLEIRKCAADVRQEINTIPNLSETTLIGGRKRQFQVFFDEEKLNQRLLTPLELSTLIQSANVRLPAGHLESRENLTNVEPNAFFTSKEDLENLVVGISRGNPVLLKDVAEVRDGPDEEESIVNIRFGAGAKGIKGGPFQAVTLSISKRKGTNASVLCDKVIEKVEELKKTRIPQDISVKITRNYGETATEKSNELLLHTGIAVIGVSLLIAFSLGFYESGVVAIAIPVTLALTLAVFYFLGFTLNRITLFALIFSIGILVDDPIVGVENIVRHLRLPSSEKKSFLEVTIEAVIEVGKPLILATLAVIASILPMAFVRGLMGPYMRPIPIGSSSAMLLSMVVSFVVTPWAANKILGYAQRNSKLASHSDHSREDFLTRVYRFYMTPLIRYPWAAKFFIVGLIVLLGLVIALIPAKKVLLKMLPFDNKNEFQVVVDMPRGTPFEKTHAIMEEIASYLSTVKEVSDIELYAGTSSPYNFNGLVRHYFLRNRPYQADLQVNLVDKKARARQSHEIADSVRPRIHEIVAKAGGHVQVAEVPPGPPVLSTLVIEIYGPHQEERENLARKVEKLLSETEGITDIDSYLDSEQKLLRFNINSEKASLNGIDNATIAATIETALKGSSADLARIAGEDEPVQILVRLPKNKRMDEKALEKISLMSRFGNMIPIRELTTPVYGVQEKTIYHKNLMQVDYVIADVTGDVASPTYALLKLKDEIAKLNVSGEDSASLKQYFTDQPFSGDEYSIKWDGEWQITYEVFRDLGIAFALVLILIYILVVGWFQSFKTPFIVMLPIPLSLIGILPAHWLSGIFFTATSMIGLIAGAGIVVRNAIILVDFIELRLSQGMALEEAVVDAGATRFRPMLLTASAVVVGSFVILFDPIFQGLAVALMAGEVASTLLSRTAVPVIYYMMMKKERA